MPSPPSFQGLGASIYARPIGPFATSASTASSALVVPTPSPAPAPAPVPVPVPSPTSAAKTKAYYRIIRLDKHEIERRNGAGLCTYCNQIGHSRRSCAAGRIMRKVPKRVLDARLRSGVCPLCGDPSNDGHCKLSCPQKLALQAALNAKRNMAGLAGVNGLADMNGVDRALPRYTDTMARYSTRSNNMTNNTAVAADSVSISTHSTHSTDDEEDDLIDFGDMRDASPANRLSLPFSPFSPSPTSSTSMSLQQKYAYTRPRRKQNHNLLDTEPTETVWGGMTLPVVKLDMDMDMNVSAEYVESTEHAEHAEPTEPEDLVGVTHARDGL